MKTKENQTFAQGNWVTAGPPEAPREVRQGCAKSVGLAESAASRKGFGRGKLEIDVRSLALGCWLWKV